MAMTGTPWDRADGSTAGAMTGEALEVVREGLGDAPRVVDADRHPAQRDQREAHGDAVVVVGVDARREA